MNALRERLKLDHPLVLAPMAGGPSTPALAAAVSEAGGLGSLGEAYETPDTIRAHVAAVRALTTKPFAINLFFDSGREPSEHELARTRELLRPFRVKFGLDPEASPKPPQDLGAQLAAVMDTRPAVLSTVFGAPDAEIVRDARARGILVVGTATTPDEADMLAARGVDAIVAQGSEAGGHRGSFLQPIEDALIGVLPLVTLIARQTRLPIVAAGGLMTGAAMAGALAAGAELCQLGTAFLLCPEAGTSAPYREILASPRTARTTLTRAFSGRWARGLTNTFTATMAGVQAELAPFPALNSLTQDLRRAATQAGDAEYLALWAGQAASLIRARPAAELVSLLAHELHDAKRSQN